MCGICGIISLNNDLVKEGQIRNMMQVQKHRGPDDEGIFIKNNVGLGFVRLSIIDLSSAGHQPMFSDDGMYVVVFNGEIFNYIELREELKQKGLEVVAIHHSDMGSICHSPGGSEPTKASTEYYNPRLLRCLFHGVSLGFTTCPCPIKTAST